MAKSRLILCAAAAMAVIVSGAANAGPQDMVKLMDPTAPKYNTPECTAARTAAPSYAADSAQAVALQGQLAYQFGIFGIMMGASAAAEVYRAQAVASDIFIEKCGPEAFVPYFQAMASKGDDVAQTWLGRFYAAKQDWPQAITWYQQAVDRKNAVAMSDLGTIYFEGNGVTKDRAQAEALWLKAADRGSIAAMTKLGDLYAADQNLAKAGEMYRSAAERNAQAAFHLAEMYEQGRGVERSDTAAYGWYCMSSIMGYAEANARRDAIAARMSRRDVETTARKVERCYFSKRCNF